MLGKHFSLDYTALAFSLLFWCIFNLYTASLTDVFGVTRFQSVHMGQRHFSFKAEPFLSDGYLEVLTHVELVLRL